MIVDYLLRGTSPSDLGVAIFYSVIGTILALILLFLAILLSSYTIVNFPTSNDGAYGFLMKSVQTRVPLANSGGGTVSPPPYNPSFVDVSVSSGAPINAAAYYNQSVPFSTSRWWSRLVAQKAPTTYNQTAPYTYSGPFNLYRSILVPSYGFTISRPYSWSTNIITGTPVCNNPQPHSVSQSVTDGAPTIFTAPILWNNSVSRPYSFTDSELSFSCREVGNMSVEMTYISKIDSTAARIFLSQIVPYIVINLDAGSFLSLNSFFRDTDYSTIKLINTMASILPPLVTPNATLMTFKTEIVPPQSLLPPLGLSQTSIVEFTVKFSTAVTVTQLADFTVIVQAFANTQITILPTKYYIASPQSIIVGAPTEWVFFDQLVSSVILQSDPITNLSAFLSNTTKGTITYAGIPSGRPLIFIPSMSMLSVGTISGAVPLSTLPFPTGRNTWVSPQIVTGAYIAQSGSFDVSYGLIDPPRFGQFNIYSAFDANSLKRLSFIFNRDLQALYAIDIPNDTFYTSVRKIFTFAQMTYAVFNYPAAILVNVLLPSLRNHLMRAFDALLQTDRDEIKLGFSPSLFTIATNNQQYSESQNQVFGDNHVGQYGMILFTFYIIVSIQFDNTARLYARDRYQNIMVDLMRDFAQPYNTDQYIPSMRHFDFGSGISWQSSSIIEATSLQVSEVLNGYYACWLVSSLFGDNKLRDFYRAILSIELATHQEYRLAPLSPNSSITETNSPIFFMLDRASALFENCSNQEFNLRSPGFYKGGGPVVFNIQAGKLVKHGVINNHPDQRYLLDNINPNNVADFSSAVFYRPMTPLTAGIVPLTLGINLNSFQTLAFSTAAGLASIGFGAPRVINGIPEDPLIMSFDPLTGLPAVIQSLEENPSSFMTIQAAYSLSDYARSYVTNYTWAGADLPPEECAIIPSEALPEYLSPAVQINKLGVLDSNTVYWIQYVIAAYGPR